MGNSVGDEGGLISRNSPGNFRVGGIGGLRRSSPQWAGSACRFASGGGGWGGESARRKASRRKSARKEPSQVGGWAQVVGYCGSESGRRLAIA